MFPLIPITLLSLWLMDGGECFGTQSVWVKGRLLCGSNPSNGVLVKLLDADPGMNPDDLLDSARTNSTGHYDVKGSSSEFGNIDPELHIFHFCNNYEAHTRNAKRCQREWVIRIPEQYIFDGDEPQKPIHLGTMNLELELENERLHCRH